LPGVALKFATESWWMSALWQSGDRKTQQPGAKTPNRSAIGYIIIAVAVEVDHDVTDIDGKPYYDVDADGNGKETPRHVSGLVLAELYMKKAVCD
jgi:hypothetical protein